MPAKVKLSDIVDGMEFQSDESKNFLNKETGELVCISDEEFRAAEEKEPLENYPEWQQEVIKTAVEILETNKYEPLPDRFDINMYEIMERFCLSIEDDNLRDRMCGAIRGRGAFRIFKDNIYRFDIQEDWYRFRDKALKEIAIEWCEDNGIKFIDE